jgi:cytochrome c553
MMRTKAVSIAALVATALLVLVGLTWWSGSMAYSQYSVNKDATNCRACHGDFRDATYISKIDGQSWADGLHDTHRGTMLNGDCDTCHFAGRFPVYLGTSQGGVGLAAISCAGCHGRAQDGTGTGSVGYGKGLRQQHYRANPTYCISCHADSNPAVPPLPVGENVLPPYYANPGTGHFIPTDPCNPPPTYNENFAATTLSLDNDGNGFTDMADAACSPATPGEVSKTPATMMLVTAYNKTTGAVSVSYTPACAATNNNVEYGNLNVSSLSTYTYAGQVCAVGNGGTATFTVPSGSFFLVVANDGTSEGSYGRRRTGLTLTERPEDATQTACPKPQVLATRCDP